MNTQNSLSVAETMYRYLSNFLWSNREMYLICTSLDIYNYGIYPHSALFYLTR